MAQIIGRIVGDAEMKKVGDVNVVTFSLAENHNYYKDGNIVEQVDYFETEYWNASEKLVEALKKGRFVVAEGRVIPNSYIALEDGEVKVAPDGKPEVRQSLRFRITNLRF